MSYDLHFKARHGEFDERTLLDYLRSRGNYRVDGRQAVYQNEDTGVYFILELSSAPDPSTSTSTDEDPTAGYPVALHINYFRPTYFIREVEPEISAIVREFDWNVLDPQFKGMGEGEYKSDLLVSGWNAGNEFAYSAILANPANRGGFLSLPTPSLARIWRWNYNRKTLQKRIGEGQFVPRILFLRLDDQAVSAVAWPDAIPALLPPVDYLFVPRNELSPRRLFRRTPDRILLAWGDAFPTISHHASIQDGDALLLNYNRPPRDVIDLIRSFPSDERQFGGVAADKVLDRELIDKVVL